MHLTPENKAKILSFQKNEITEYYIYSRLAKRISSVENRRVLEHIAQEELDHYGFWHSITHENVKPNRILMLFYYFISRLLGFTFGLKLMEMNEDDTKLTYEALREHVPNVDLLIKAEQEHEEALMQLLDEEKLKYMGSIVLGLNDALVELTGALAGLTLALQNTKLIALAGLITGVAAALSMAASEYLSTKSEETVKNPVRASFYTGMAYIFTVFLLISPYLIIDNYYLCLLCTLLLAIGIIAFFNYYLAIAKGIPFKERFLEMSLLSLSVAAFSFGIGYAIRKLLGIEL